MAIDNEGVVGHSAICPRAQLNLIPSVSEMVDGVYVLPSTNKLVMCQRRRKWRSTDVARARVNAQCHSLWNKNGIYSGRGSWRRRS